MEPDDQELLLHVPKKLQDGTTMRGSTFWLAIGVLLFLAWGVSYFVFHVAGVLIHLLLVLALMSFMFSAFIGKGGVE